MGDLLQIMSSVTFLSASAACADKLNSVYILTGCSLFLDIITFLILFRSSACNIALKLLAPKLDRLSYRYSKVIRIGGYFGE